MVHVGIDIGTSNTVISTFDGGGLTTRIIENERLVPSVVYFEAAGGRTTVGREAVDEWADPAFDPALSFRRWKLRMGEDATLGEVAIGGGKKKTAITPEKLTTWLVEYVIEKVAEGVGGDDIESVVVTVPHGWRREHPEKCLATRTAATDATVRGGRLPVRDVTLSEPVAAASYWLWAARKGEVDLDAVFVGKTVLVVDIGGGTFDLSLVRIGAAGEPLVVVDAINHDVAGDYVTALVLARVTTTANETLAIELPTDPDELLRIIASGESVWARKWFLTAQHLVHEMSLRIGQAAKRGRTALAASEDFEVPESGESVRLRIEPVEFGKLLEPFYAAGREIIARFLRLQDAANLPCGVVFAGGGSRIAGVRERIVEPALVGIVSDARSVLERITLNDSRIDEAVSLGAALVAAGEVSVEERLLYDIGIKLTVPGGVAAELGLGDERQDVIVSPVLERGAKLPATAESSQLIGDLAVAAGAELNFEVYVFDDPHDPHWQAWNTTHIADGKRASVSVLLTATTDGVLNFQVADTTSGAARTLTGKTERVRTGRASLELDIAGGSPAPLTIVTPSDLAQAAAKARRAGGQK